MSGRMLLPWIVLLLVGGAAPAVADIPGELSSILTKSDGDVASALDDLRRDVAKGGDEEDWRDLGIAQCRAGQYGEAVKSFRRAAALADEDFWMAAYHGLALQESGAGLAAAARYAAAAGHDTKLSDQLRARADLLRAQSLVLAVDPETGIPEEATSVAVLTPRDLGGNGTDHVGPLGTAIAAALAANPAVTVLWPADVEAWLAHDGRSAADLDDEARKDRIARTMARRGVDALLSTSFLWTATGELHLRPVLLPVGPEGLGESVSLASGVGAAGAECAPLEEPIVEVWTALGANPAANATHAIPSLAAAGEAHAGLQALREGRFADARAGVCAARQRHAEVASLQQWCGVLSQVAASVGPETLAQAGDADALEEALRDLALSERKKQRRFDDF